jgi:hypothetical protein
MYLYGGGTYRFVWGEIHNEGRLKRWALKVSSSIGYLILPALFWVASRRQSRSSEPTAGRLHHILHPLLLHRILDTPNPLLSWHQEVEQEFRTNLLVVFIIFCILSSSIGYLILPTLFWVANRRQSRRSDPICWSSPLSSPSSPTP